jgi:scyllo-inositol 2-dehydrogenase (NAD+)
MTELRMAVVGAGRMGLTHAENLVHRTRGARLVAVTTSSAERVEAIRRRCGEVPVYATLDRLIESESLDAVVISSSTSAHVDNVEQCAAAGVHILCEKPLGLTLEECGHAEDAVDTAGVKLMIGHTRRFDAGYQEAKRLIESGAVGRPVLYRSLSGDVDPPPPEFADLGVSGGLILDSMYHDIYLGRWLMDQEITRVHGEGSALIDDRLRSVGDVDNAVLSARFADGSVGTLCASRTTRYGHDLRTEVIGDEGAVHIGRLRKTPVRLLDRSGAHHDAVFTTPERMGEAFVSMLQAFVDSIVNDTEPPVLAADARSTLAIAIAGRRSIQTGEPVEIHNTTNQPPDGGTNQK